MLAVDPLEFQLSRKTKLVHNRIFNRRPFPCTGNEYHYENSGSGVRVLLVCFLTFWFCVACYFSVSGATPLFFAYVLSPVFTAYLENRLVARINSRYAYYEASANEQIITFMRLAGELVFEFRFRLEVTSFCFVALGSSYLINTIAFYQVSALVCAFAIFILASRLFFLYRFVLQPSEIKPEINILWIILLSDFSTLALSVYFTFVI